jgi:DNA-binding XRE family transcriptional regulator
MRAYFSHFVDYCQQFVLTIVNSYIRNAMVILFVNGGANLTIEAAFGETIRELRKQKRLSQEDVANESGLDRSFISLLETGRQQPSLITIFQLAKTLGISAGGLITVVEEKLQR